jgi:hypothetical protein
MRFPALRAQSRRRRHRGRLELLGGVLVSAFATLFYWMWRTDTSGHGERALLLLPVILLGPFGAGSMLAGAAVRYSWPKARWFSIAPFLFTAAAVFAFWIQLF